MGARILIVDDEPDVATYLAAVLRANGFEPETADSVEAGLRLVRTVHPEVVCLDIMMPEELGISLYTRMRQDATLRDIPVVIITGAAPNGQFDFRAYVSDESIPEPDEFLEKPVAVDEFIAIIKRLVKHDNSEMGGS